MSNDTLPASSPDAELIKLGGELEDVHRQRLAADEDDALYDAHWDLRAKIEAIPAKTDAGRRVKARAVEMALHFDQDHENNGAGSFASLSQALCRDLLAHGG